MKKIPRYLLSLFIESCLLLVGIFFFFESSIKALIILIILLIIMIAITIILLLKSAFEYEVEMKKDIKIEDDKLLITQKDNIILSFNKNNLENVVVIYDLFFENIDYIKFKYNNKKYLFVVPEKMNDNLKVFIKDLNYKRRRYILFKIFLLLIGGYS